MVTKPVSLHPSLDSSSSASPTERPLEKEAAMDSPHQKLILDFLLSAFS